MPRWTEGDVSGSETLTIEDHLYESHINELRETFDKLFYDVTSYGATGDGATDDTVSIQATIDSVNSDGGGVVFFPIGVYIISSTLILYSNITLKGISGQSVLDFSAETETFIAVSATGSVGDAVELAESATAGDNDLALITNLLAADDHLFLYAETIRTPIVTKAGEIVRVKTITDGDNLVLYNDIYDTYVTGDTAAIKKITFVENIGVDGLNFEGPADTEVAITGIQLQYCKDIKIRDCILNSTHYKGVKAISCIKGSVTDCKFLDIEKAGLGYGVGLEDTSQDWIISNNIADNVKNFCNIGANNGDYGLVRRVNACGNVCTNMWGSAFDAHDNADDINYSNNVISGYQGFNLRCKNIVICNNIVDCYYKGLIYQPLTNLPSTGVISGNIFKGGSDKGIAITQTTDDYGNIVGLTISNNIVSENSGRAIIIYGSNNLGPIENLIISGNALSSPVGVGGIRIVDITGGVITGNSMDVTGDSAKALYLSQNCIRIAISNNFIDSESSTGTAGIRLEDGSDDCTIMGNIVVGAATGITLSDTCEYNNVVGNNVRNCTAGIVLGSGTGNSSGENIV